MNASEELTQAAEAYQKGDQEAFATLYEQSYRYLYACVIRIVKSEDITQDMLQETYLEIVKNINTLRSPGDFLSWAAVIATNKCFAYFKKNRDFPVEDVEETFEEIPDDEAFIPEEVMQDREKQRLFREIIDSLSDMQRLCVIGYYYNEQSQESLAREFGIPVGTVKSHLNRARVKIRQAVEELDVKKDTRLYNVTPLMLLLMEEEIKTCILHPMSAALAAAAGVGKGTAESFSVMGKLKALWAKLSVGAKAKAAAGAVAVCTAGAAAAVALTQAPQTPVISDEAKGLLDQIVAICEEGNYEELCMLDYSALDTVEDDEEFNNINCYDKKGRIVNRYFYDGQSNELKADYTGYGIGINGWYFAIGQFNHGKAQGRLVTVRITCWDAAGLDSYDSDEFFDYINPDVTISEMNVENGMITGEAANRRYELFNDFHNPMGYLYEHITGEAGYINYDFNNPEEGIRGIIYDIRFVGKITYNRYFVEDLFTGETEEESYVFYLDDAGHLDTERNQYVDGQWLDLEGKPCDLMEQYIREDGTVENIRIHADWDYFDIDESKIVVDNP
ncbi:MAG: RNA polymerase sigma factor [Roseburia sp.]|nr:RNA polymerase sigma factor [Roseburia sp.]